MIGFNSRVQRVSSSLRRRRWRRGRRSLRVRALLFAGALLRGGGGGRGGARLLFHGARVFTAGALFGAHLGAVGRGGCRGFVLACARGEKGDAD